MKRGWSLIRSGAKTDGPHPVGLFLGCHHRTGDRTLPGGGPRVRYSEYDMEQFLMSCVDRYKELTGCSVLRRVTTPYLDEPSTPVLEPGSPVPPGCDMDSRGQLLESAAHLSESTDHEHDTPVASLAGRGPSVGATDPTSHPEVREGGPPRSMR